MLVAESSAVMERDAIQVVVISGVISTTQQFKALVELL